MTQIYVSPFSHKLPTGKVVIIEAEVWYEPALDFNTSTASSDWDTQEHLEIVAITVMSSSGEPVDTVLEQDAYYKKILLRELHIQAEFQQEDSFDFEGGLYE